MNLGKSICNTLSELKGKRQQLETVWKDCFDLTAPERGAGFYENDTENYLDTSKRADIYDSTGSDSVQLFASALMSGLTPSNSSWFNLTLNNIDVTKLSGESNAWLQKAGNTMFNAIHSSNYDAVALEFLKDIAIAGMSGLYIELDNNGRLVFEQWPLATLYVQESTRNGGIDTVYRSLLLTPHQAHNLFGDKIPEAAKEAIKNEHKLNEADCYVHCIRPRKGKNVNADAKLVDQMPFESIYVHQKSGTVVKKGGFNEFPVVIPRWALVPNSSYAYGQFNISLPDMKTLNEMSRHVLTNAEMVINPPLVADDDGVLNANNIRFGPREVTFKSPNGDIKPLYTGTDLSWALNLITEKQESVRRQMLADQIAPAQKQYMTAHEIMQRRDTLRSLLGPLFARFESEFLRPLLTRVFGLLYRAGAFLQPTDELKNVDLIPSFTGPHARAQRMEEANKITNYVQVLSSIAQIDNSVLDIFDFDEASRLHAELTGVEKNLIRDPRQVEELREKRMQQQMMLAQQNAGQQ